MSSKRLREESVMSSRKLNLIFVVASILVVCLVSWLIPETRGAFTVVLNILWTLILFLVMIIVPGLVMAGVRSLIEYVYEKYGEPQYYVSEWVHFFVCLALSLCMAVLWIWGVRFIVDLPSWINAYYTSGDGSDYLALIERLPWGWVATGFVSSVLGYIFGSEDNRDIFF